MTKTDKILDDCWNSHPNEFGAVNRAVLELIEKLVNCAISKGVSRRVANDTYIDWVRQKMHEEDFM